MAYKVTLNVSRYLFSEMKKEHYLFIISSNRKLLKSTKKLITVIRTVLCLFFQSF